MTDGVTVRRAEPEEAPAGEAGLPDGEPEEADVSLACTPTVQSGDTAVERDESPAAAVRKASGAQTRTEGSAGGRCLTAAGPAARAWVEDPGQPWRKRFDGLTRREAEQYQAALRGHGIKCRIMPWRVGAPGDTMLK